MCCCTAIAMAVSAFCSCREEARPYPADVGQTDASHDGCAIESRVPQYDGECRGKTGCTDLEGTPRCGCACVLCSDEKCVQIACGYVCPDADSGARDTSEPPDQGIDGGADGGPVDQGPWEDAYPDDASSDAGSDSGEDEPRDAGLWQPSSGLLDACARYSACLSAEGKYGFGGWCEWLATMEYRHSMSNLRGTEDQVHWAAIECSKKATNCDEFVGCYYIELGTAEYCYYQDYGGNCLQGIHYDCANHSETGKHSIQNCAAAGVDCVVEKEGLYASCGEPCSGYGTMCEGDVLVHCHHDDPFATSEGPGSLRKIDCRFDSNSQVVDGKVIPYFSDTCGMNAVLGIIHCTGSGEPCTTSTFNGFCDGNALVTCRWDRVSRHDCVLEHPDAVCKVDEGGIADCRDICEECSRWSFEETCDNGLVTFCLFGRITRLDCKEFGWSGCAVYDESAPKRVYCTD
jgi:hypothetical protein